VGTLERLARVAKGDVAAAERLPEAGDAQHRHDLWPHPAHDFAQALAALAQLVGGQLVGAGRCDRNEVGDAHALGEQFRLRVRRHAARRVDHGRRDPGAVQGRPEPVAAAGEVRIHRRRPQARVDADEQQPDVGAEQVVDRRPVERLQLGAAEARRQVRLR
jgi:hypothetical protein